MNCLYCGTELPDGALFCPECGRAVTFDRGLVSANAAGFSIADLAASPFGERAHPGGGGGGGGGARCPQCAEPIAGDEVFCGECGFVLLTPAVNDEQGSSAAAFDDDDVGLATSIIVLPDLITLGSFSSGLQTDPEPGPDAGAVSGAHVSEGGESDETTEVEPVVYGALDALPVESAPSAAAAEPEMLDEPSIDDLVHASPAAAAAAAAPTPAIDPDLEFDDPSPFALPVPSPMMSPRARPTPDPFPWGSDRPLREDIEATRLIADTASGIRFVLQFSTGESVTVLGTGLVGRNPSMQPGEFVDQLVPIFDAGKSVSKTHLEYGQEAGRFWISDRYSTNGSTIRQPDAEPRRAEPGRRYYIARGTRIDVGEQFFVVS